MKNAPCGNLDVSIIQFYRSIDYRILILLSFPKITILNCLILLSFLKITILNWFGRKYGCVHVKKPVEKTSGF